MAINYHSFLVQVSSSSTLTVEQSLSLSSLRYSEVRQPYHPQRCAQLRCTLLNRISAPIIEVGAKYEVSASIGFPYLDYADSSKEKTLRR
jgi:hypothetical protein